MSRFDEEADDGFQFGRSPAGRWQLQHFHFRTQVGLAYRLGQVHQGPADASSEPATDQQGRQHRGDQRDDQQYGQAARRLHRHLVA